MPAGVKDKENIDDTPGINWTNSKWAVVLRQPQKDDIRTTYHPKSGRSAVVKAFEEYGLGKPAPPLTLPTIPWLPFSSESEFSFAEVILESAMSNTQVDKLIQVIHTLIERKETFRVKNHKELNNLWIGASDPLTPFEKKVVKAEY